MTLASRIHRKGEVASVKENTTKRFPVGKDISVTDKGNPFAIFGRIIEEVSRCLAA
jgi:transcription termination/antitermination protein NusG